MQFSTLICVDKVLGRGERVINIQTATKHPNRFVALRERERERERERDSVYALSPSPASFTRPFLWQMILQFIGSHKIVSGLQKKMPAGREPSEPHSPKCDPNGVQQTIFFFAELLGRGNSRSL